MSPKGYLAVTTATAFSSAKRLSSGRFRHWPDGASGARQLEAHELQLLLSAGDPGSGGVPTPWKRLEKSG